MILHQYRCNVCQRVDDAFDDEPIPSCCEGEMVKLLAKGGPSGVAFKLFRPYSTGDMKVESKDQEKRMLTHMAGTHRGESAENLYIERVDPNKRKVEIEEKRHEVLKTLGARNPRIAKSIMNRPIPTIKEL